MTPVPAPMGKPYRVSSNSVWPLRGVDGRTFAQAKEERNRDAVAAN